MTTARRAVSKWMLGCELLVCFAPLTLLFVAVLPLAFGGPMPLLDAWLLLAAGVAGPLGLVASASALVRPHAAAHPAVVAALCVAAAWTLLAFLSGTATASAGPIGEWWREFVLIAVLPLMGTVHLTALATASGRTPRTA